MRPGIVPFPRTPPLSLHPPARLLLSKRSVLLLAHRLHARLPQHGDLRNPRLALGVLVHITGLVLERRVDLCNGTRDGCEDVGSRLYRLNGANGVTFADVHFYLWELNVDYVAEGFCCVFGDAEGACVDVLVAASS